MKRLCLAKFQEKILEEFRAEVKDTWSAARNSGSQMQAFNIFERMTDRLGYGRTENNPKLF